MRERHDLGSYTDKHEGDPRDHWHQMPHFVDHISPENKNLGPVVPRLAVSITPYYEFPRASTRRYKSFLV